MIPMVDVNRQHQALRPELDAAIASVLDSGFFILGPQVRAFEEECAAYLGANHAVACASGTDALMLALTALGIGPGDEVITTPFTFIATAEAIRYRDAKPVFVDIDPVSLNIDTDRIEAAITPKTKAILPVHLFGLPANMQAIMQIADARGLKIVEDCAQSFGARYNDQMTGSIGDAGCFSFFPSKNLGGLGDGGLTTCRDAAIADQLRVLRNHGSRVRYYHEVIGYNSRLDELQAAMLRVKLKHMDQYNAERRRVAASYTRRLAGHVETPPAGTKEFGHVYHQYTLLSDQRDTILERLKGADIASAIYYPVPLHQQSVFSEFCKGQSFPVTESVAKRCLSLPIFPELTDPEIEQIANVILSAAG